MKNGLNRVTIAGTLGADAELRSTQGGQSVANFRVAVNETWKDKNGEKQERCEWVPIVLWGKTADAIAEYLVKGKDVLVEGKLQTRSWEKDGQKRYTTEVVASNVLLLGGGGNRQDGGGSRRNDNQESFGAGDDDIPF